MTVAYLVHPPYDGDVQIDYFLAEKRDDQTVEIAFFRTGMGRHRLDPVGGMQVNYFEAGEPDAGKVSAVELAGDGPLTASALRRFAWSKWLEVADDTIRRKYTGFRGYENPYMVSGNPDEDPEGWGPRMFPGEPDMRLSAYFSTYGESFRRSPLPRPANSHPGRRGHPREHYEEIAKRYRELRAEGAKDPTARIAAEGFYSRNTVAGWVRRARELELLPPARRGRAG